jgi:hypothetical protein
VISILKILEILNNSDVKVNRKERTIKVFRGDKLVVVVKFYDDDIFDYVCKLLEHK